MKIINSSYEILTDFSGTDLLKKIESIGRVCYKSEKKIERRSYDSFINRLIKSGHESVIEHVSITVRIICDRGISHEIVRHRIASYSQESTRYCNYCDGCNEHITFIKPSFWNENSSEYKLWENTMREIEKTYRELIKIGASPQEARSVLPNSLKTELIMTMNLREWRHFFKLRTSYAAHPQMREIIVPLFEEMKKKIPIIFDDIIA